MQWNNREIGVAGLSLVGILCPYTLLKRSEAALRFPKGIRTQNTLDASGYAVGKIPAVERSGYWGWKPLNSHLLFSANPVGFN